MKVIISPLRLVRQSATRPWHIVTADLGAFWYRAACGRPVRGEVTQDAPAEGERMCPACEKKANTNAYL